MNVTRALLTKVLLAGRMYDYRVSDFAPITESRALIARLEINVTVLFIYRRDSRFAANVKRELCIACYMRAENARVAALRGT